jgi:phytoene dehydrogenase-like protein
MVVIEAELETGAAAEVEARAPHKVVIEVEAAVAQVIVKVGEAAVEVVAAQGVDVVVKAVAEDVDADSRANLLQHQRVRLQPLATPKFSSYISTRYSLAFPPKSPLSRTSSSNGHYL